MGQVFQCHCSVSYMCLCCRPSQQTAMMASRAQAVPVSLCHHGHPGSCHSHSPAPSPPPRRQVRGSPSLVRPPSWELMALIATTVCSRQTILRITAVRHSQLLPALPSLPPCFLPFHFSLFLLSPVTSLPSPPLSLFYHSNACINMMMQSPIFLPS